MENRLGTIQIGTNVRINKSQKSSQTALLKSALATAYAVAPALTERWVAKRFLTPARHPWPKAEQTWLESAVQGNLYTQDLPVTEWNFKQMRTYRWGNPERGRVAILHGWSGRTTQFYSFIAAFVDAGYEVVGIDAPGHGASAGNQSSVFHFLNALERLIRNSGPVDAVIGHSMGGGVALYALANGLKATKAVLIAPNADLVLYSRMVARQLGLSEARRQSLQNRIELMFGASWNSVNSAARAPEVSQRGLVIHDRDDREIPASMGEAIANAWPGADLLLTSGLGHRRILQDAGVVAATLAFVNNV